MSAAGSAPELERTIREQGKAIAALQEQLDARTSAPAPKSFGNELLRIIREEIADYDARKAREAEAERLKRVAESAAIRAECAANDVDRPNFMALFGDPRAKALDAFADRFASQPGAKGHLGSTFLINTTDPARLADLNRITGRTQTSTWSTDREAVRTFAAVLRRHDAQRDVGRDPQVDRLAVSDQAEPSTFTTVYQGAQFTFTLDGELVSSAPVVQHDHSSSPSSDVDTRSVGDGVVPGPENSYRVPAPGSTTEDGAL